jgi:hypothetical protein
MVHLEGVKIVKWGIKANEDQRPGESLSLEYTKSAMQYTLTLDGKEFAPSTAVGWDHDAHDYWPNGDTWFFDKYLPKF